MELVTAWDRLDNRFRSCLELAWLSFGRRGLPVGSVIANDAEVVARGRNRVYDLPGGSDPLQQTPIAHAEMNAMAALPAQADVSRCTIWSTHEPCSMCSAAIDFIGLGSVHALARDPSDETFGGEETARTDEGPWAVVANVLFIHNVAWVVGRDSSIVGRNAGIEPEITSLALRLLDEKSLIDASNGGEDLLVGLGTAWDGILEASQMRLTRR